MARPGRPAKTERNQKIRKIQSSQPELSLEQIGLMFRISKQRVWQIVQEGKHG